MKNGYSISDYVYYFNESMMLDCNMYLLENSQGDFCLIDSGNGQSMPDLVSAMTKLNLSIGNIREVLITHEHLDHVLGLYSLLNILEANPPTIYAHEQTAAILTEGDAEKICPSMIGIPVNEFNVSIRPIKVEILNEEDVHSFGDFSFQIYNTPVSSLGN